MFLKRHRLAIGFLASLVIAVLIALVAYRNTQALRQASRWVERSHEATAVLESALVQIEAAETAQRGYIITGNDTYRREAQEKRPAIEATLARLERMVRRNPDQMRKLATLRAAVNAKLEFVDHQLKLREESGFEAVRAVTASGEGSLRMERVIEAIDAMKQEEDRLLAERRHRSERQARLTVVTVLIGTIINLALVTVIFLLVRRDQMRSRALSHALSEARDAALQAAEFRSQFLANMSHEVRTPLNAVVGMTGLLLDTRLDANQRELANTVRASADALLTLVNDILDFSKIDAGKLMIEQTDFEVRQSVESVVDLFSEAAAAKGLELGALFDHDLPPMVRGDSGRIRQIVTNFVSNAVKFTEQGEVIVHVNKEREDETMVQVRFAVTDTGIGMPEEVAARLFQPFMQADASTTREYGGTGLGLVITKQLAELMGGTAGADSAAGKGSTFWCSIPLLKVAAEETPLGLESKLSELRILVVDGSDTARRLILHNLSAWKMQTGEAATGEEAIHRLHEAMADEKPFDIVLFDDVLPDTTGVILARFIKADKIVGKVKLIATTSVSNRMKDEVMTGAGIDQCITRPVRQSTLYDALVSVISGKARIAALNAYSEEARPMRNDVRVLIAEDNAVNQKLAVRQLQRLGLHSDTVGNGLEAVEALNRIPYDLVLMDCQMPEMDGFEATREVRRREGKIRRTPIIALTANALTGDRERCLEAGMDDYLSKPVRQQELAGLVDKWLPLENADPLDMAVIATLQGLGGGSDDFLREVLTLFREDAAERLRAMREAVDQQNPAALASAAHALKSSAGSAGAHKVRQIAAELELMGNERSVAGAHALVEKLSAAITRACDRMLEVSASSEA